MSTGRFPGRLYPQRPVYSRPPLVIRGIPVEDPPIVNSVTSTSISTNQTSHVISMYGRVVSGDLLIGICESSGTTTPTVSWPGGWTVFNVPATGTSFLMSCAYKRPTGPESAFTLTTATAATSVTRILQVKNAHSISAPEAGTELVTTGTSFTPPSLNPSGWNGENTLWIVAVLLTSATGSVSAYPAGYSRNQGVTQATGLTLAHAQRASIVDTESPGSMTTAPSGFFRVNTIAVRPAPAVARTGNHLLLSA